MAHEILPGITLLDDTDLTDDEQALIKWSESDIYPNPEHSDTLTGQAAIDSGILLMSNALGSYDNLVKLLL